MPYPSISDHYVLYIVADIPTNKFQPRLKNIKILKNFTMDEFISDFKLIMFSTGSSFGKINDQLDTLNRLIIKYLDKHAPLWKVKITRLPAPWMKDYVL